MSLFKSYYRAMAKFESVNLLFKLLKEARYPIPKTQLQEYLECSAATIERYLTELRETYGQKVEYIREFKGYQLISHEDDIELPSHLFSSQEINAILLVDQLIDELEPGFLKDDMQSVKQHLSRIKGNLSINQANTEKRIRMINIGKRESKHTNLSQITQAVLQRKLVSIAYESRSSSSLTSKSSRLLSPQRLTHYRDNWYLDAWCHDKKELRTFSLERIKNLHVLKSDDKYDIVNLTDEQLDKHYSRTFGIFGGKIKNNAILKFTEHRAQWVSEELWHQDQKGHWLDDGSYQLEIPYGNDLELIGDILKYGDQVEVIAPIELRQKMKQQIDQLLALYE